MKTFIDEARYLFLESTGWSRLTWRDRWVAAYFALSLCAVCIIKEAPVWVWIAVAVNFMNAARMVRQIDLPELSDGDGEPESPSNDSKHDNNDRPGAQPPAAASAA
jgi:hypothetical protein